ncbi:MAG: hypothetical protein ACRDWB_13780 [Acidimicrobiales bacterium]
MPGRPSAKRAAADAAGHLRRSTTWQGLHTGDPVMVSGVKLRGATWQFRAHVLNERNGSESVEVVGGRPGDRKLRSFEPTRIFAVSGRLTGSIGSDKNFNDRLSLADAPQLPFC